MNHHNKARRQFLKRCAQMALLGTTASAVNGKMSLMGSALATSSNYRGFNDYKALVCIFLHGGSDSFNLFVPYDQTGYNEYSQARGTLAIPRQELLPDTSNNIGFHPNLGALRDSYNAGDLAVVRNVGNLIEPVTPLQFQNNPELIPADLFAHNSQQEQVQKSWSSKPVGLVGAGWGGRMADLLTEANTGGLPPTFSMANANFFQPGNITSPISVNPLYGPNLLPFLDATGQGSNVGRQGAFEAVMQLPTDHLLERFAIDSVRNARDSSRALNSVISNSPDLGPVDENNRLDVQLRMIARMIAGRQELGMKRQIFFASVGGWDTHDNQTPRLDELTQHMNAAISNFQDALVTLNAQNEVTTFTTSEFGRTLTINGDGSDHGWGGHYMVMGGAVNGGQLYGNWPEYAVGGANNIGSGRLIPEMSINQYGAALGSWMGVSNSDMLDVFPDLDRFDTGWQNQYGLFG